MNELHPRLQELLDISYLGISTESNVEKLNGIIEEIDRRLKDFDRWIELLDEVNGLGTKINPDCTNEKEELLTIYLRYSKLTFI